MSAYVLTEAAERDLNDLWDFVAQDSGTAVSHARLRRRVPSELRVAMWTLRTLLLLTAAAIAGCDSASAPPIPAGWQTVTVGKAFTFRAPPDLTPVPVQGIDSLVGHYASPSLDVSFDYGWYSDPMKREGYTYRWVTVDGKNARLITKGDVVAIHFPEVTGETRLTMRVRLKGATPELAETLLRSIDFP